MFCRVNRRKLMEQKEHVGKAPSQISKLLGDEWRMLSVEDKKIYQEQSRKEVRQPTFHCFSRR